MPGARKARKGMTQVGKNAQIRGGGSGAQGGGGPSTFDGRANMSAGTPSPEPSRPPKRKAAIVMTHS